MLRTRIIVALMSAALCACGEHGAADYVDWTIADPPSGTSSSGGGQAPDGAECPVLPSALRAVRADDSRGVDANTIVLAAATHDQSLWLPSAAEHAGAVVVVADVVGGGRRVSVYTAGADTFGDGSVEHVSTRAWSSRTFAAIAYGDSAAWFLVYDVK